MDFLNTLEEDSFDEVEEELMALESIYDVDSGEIIIEKNSTKSNKAKTIVHVQIKPLTGGANSKILVKGTLKLSLSKKYPEESIPDISLVKVKGLSDKEEKECIDRLVKLATEYLGEPSLPLICDACQEIFTEFNHADCSICLEKLSDNHVGVRTNCFHAFHETCLSEYYLRCRAIKATGSTGGETLDLDAIKQEIQQIRVNINNLLVEKKNITKELNKMESNFRYFSKEFSEMDSLKRKLTKNETFEKHALERKCKLIVVDIDAKKIDKKNVKQMLDKLLWKEKEFKANETKIEKANKTMVQADFNNNFNLPCPVCRSEITYSGCIENILLHSPNGHPLYRRSGKIISTYSRLEGENSKVSSLKDKTTIEYVKTVQMEHKTLRNKLKKNAGNENVDGHTSS